MSGSGMRTALRWVGGVVLALAFAVACVFLGRWQYGKYVTKRTMADAITNNYAAPAVPLSATLAAHPPSPTQQWTAVTATGSYDTAATQLVRNRPQNSTPGFEVLVPLRTPVGTVLVDRGWVAQSGTADTLPTPAAPPAGQVTVTGWLLSSEPDLGRDLPPGQLESISVDDASAQLGMPLVPAYLLAKSENPPPATALGTLPPPSTDLGPNQAYAYQWWLFSSFGFILLGWRVKVARDARRSAVDAQDRAAEPASVPARPSRAKKVRIWDEEDG